MSRASGIVLKALQLSLTSLTAHAEREVAARCADAVGRKVEYAGLAQKPDVEAIEILKARQV